MTDYLDDAQRDQRAAAARALIPHLLGQGVQGVAATWIDNSGMTRVKGVPLGRLESAAAWGIGMSPVFDAFLPDDSIVAGRVAGGPVGDLRLHPDLARLTVLAESPGWAWAPVDRYNQDGTVHSQDQRSLARHAVAALAAAGYSAKMAFEIEWALGLATEDDSFAPATTGHGYGFARLMERSGYLADLLAALDRQGVVVEQIHPEYGAGQYELSVGPEDPVAAADTSVLVRETIRALSHRHGLRASFSPKVVPVGVGNGGHVHLSLWRDGANIFAGGSGQYGLHDDAVAFSAGILSRLAALLAIGAPSPISYLRLIPSHWAGAFAAWGLENRETALRMVTGSPAHVGAANLEVKSFDLAANPYLVVAGLIYAGLAGLEHREALPAPVEVDPASLSAAERDARGIAPLPTSLEQTVAAFEADAALTAAFGDALAQTLVDVRRGEIDRLADADPDELTDLLRWKF